MKNKIFESVYSNGKMIAPSFSEFKKIYERTDFSDVDKKKLNDIYLWGDDSSFFDKDKSLMQALNIDTEDEVLMPKIANSIPAFSSYFSPEAAKKTKGIDLVSAQVEFIKTKISEFEKAMLSSLTGKEEGSSYQSSIPSIKAIAGSSNITQELVDEISRVFSRVSGAPGTGPLKPSIDQFVSTDEGKAVVKFLEDIGTKLSTEKVIDNAFKKLVEKLGEQNLDVAMESADATDLEEITNENVSLREDINYVSAADNKTQIDLMQSLDPFVRLGMFYQLAIEAQKDFAQRVIPSSAGQGVNYSGMIESGKTADESLKILFGRDLDLGPIQDALKPLNSISQNIIKLKWDSPESDETRATLFIPAMQVVYVALLNFVVLKGLHTFLTKKTEIVQAAATKAAEQPKINQILSGAIIPDFSDPKVKQSGEIRAKAIIAAMNALEKEEFFKDPNQLYSDKKNNLNPEAISLLKIIFAATPKLGFTEPVPMKMEDINGSFTPAFKNAIIQFQRMSGLKADGIIGPNTRESLMDYKKQLVEKYPTA